MDTGKKVSQPKRPIDAGRSTKSKYRMMLNILIPNPA